MADTVLSSADSKDRNPAWATILYPESCNPDFLSIIRSSGYRCLLSPLHDLDVDEDGVLKKPHYHLLVWFKGSRRKSQFEKLRVALSGVGVEKIGDPLGYSRYLCHLDDLDKAQYSPSEVISFGGLNYQSILARSLDNFQVTLELVDFAFQCTSFSDFARQVRFQHPEYMSILVSKSYFFNNLIRDRRNEEYDCKVSRQEECKFRGQEDWSSDLGCDCPFSSSD